MMKTRLFLLAVLVLFFNCKSFVNKFNKSSTLSLSEKDSIQNILKLVCGDWKYNGVGKKALDKRGILIFNTSITCGVTMNNYDNDFLVYETLTMGSVGAHFPKYTDSLFLPASKFVKISKRGKYYGFLYENDILNKFIPITILNDSLLILSEGKMYKRVKD